MLIFAALAITGSQVDPTMYSVTVVPDFGERQLQSGFLLLTDPVHANPLPMAPRFLQLAISPRPPSVPAVAWTSSGGVHLRLAPSFGFRMPAQPAGAVIDRAGTVGPFTVTAMLGPPIDVRTTVAGFAYERIVLGCAHGNSAGIRFDVGGIPRLTDRPADADMYITGPVDKRSTVLDTCPSAFYDANATKFTLHVPGGAVELNTEADGFPGVTARDWKPAATATAFDVSQLHGTLLLRTRDHRLVKSLVRAKSDDAMEGPCLGADAHDRFADTTSTQRAATTQIHTPDDAIAHLKFMASLATDDAFTPYDRLQDLEITKPYGGSLFPDRRTSLEVVLDPLVDPPPSITWSMEDAVTPPDGSVVVEGRQGFGPGYVSVAGNRPGRTTMVASIGSPISRRLTIQAVSYDALTLSAQGTPNAVRFVGERVVAVPGGTPSDLSMSRDGTLHFPGGGNLLTNGNDPLRMPPRFAGAGSAFTKLQPDAWHNDRDSLDLATWHGATSPCYVRDIDGSDRFDPACTMMSANVLLFKLKDGRYVKLHILDFVDTEMRASFAISNSAGTFDL